MPPAAAKRRGRPVRKLYLSPRGDRRRHAGDRALPWRDPPTLEVRQERDQPTTDDESTGEGS